MSTALQVQSAAFVGLIKMHAHELAQTAEFKRSRRFPVGFVVRVQKDLAQLSGMWDLTYTMDCITDLADDLLKKRATA